MNRLTTIPLETTNGRAHCQAEVVVSDSRADGRAAGSDFQISEAGGRVRGPGCSDGGSACSSVTPASDSSYGTTTELLRGHGALCGTDTGFADRESRDQERTSLGCVQDNAIDESRGECTPAANFEAQRAMGDDREALGHRVPGPLPIQTTATTCASFVFTDTENAEAERKEKVIREWRALQAPPHSLSGRQAAKALGRPASWFSQVVPEYDARGFEALLPRRSNSGRNRIFTEANEGNEEEGTVVLPPWFVAACQFYYIRSNRTREAGSVPAAVRAVVSLPLCKPHFVKPLREYLVKAGVWPSDRPFLPTCPEQLREDLLAREREGKAILPVRLRREIAASPMTIAAVRSPRNAWLKFVESPGSLMITVDEDGAERYLNPGEWATIDDATINFGCCVPLARPGDACWDRWGVSLGRFQFLLVVDHRSYCITGFSFTARPRSSYRAEDLTATMHSTFLTHGCPRFMVMENGISAANLVKGTLDALGVGIIRVKSPHQKVVEGVFNKLWTRLSFERGQVGRFRGEEEEGNHLLERCRTGAHDPRKYFPMLADVLQALREAIAEHNATMISGRYGRWVPQDFYNKEAPKFLKPLDASRAWAFSPVITEPLVVRSQCLKTSVPLMPGYSHRFAFGGLPALIDFYGAKVKLFFNPLAPECIAKAVLGEAWRGHRAGEVIGDMVQIDREVRLIRRTMGYGDDPDLRMSRQHSLALRRVAQGVKTGERGEVKGENRGVVQQVEVRDGLGNAATVETGTQTRDRETTVEDLTARRARAARELAEFEKENGILV